MGFLSGVKERRQARIARIRQRAYDKAIAAGKTPEEADRAADRALRKRRAVLIGGGGS
ncbi:hypothetical protein HJ588_01195 [Flexivirga sp. ID2601S]|uniref:Uncharacterized protein n=1 Tax=Flexivirga aerilata TaxID=1656889 RepID=A0A849AF81_9MICO|nr:hypothetical protein [Flexivirga aerilata]NNG37891.1 hypothetical protein [Flexivirga aerilata]